MIFDINNVSWKCVHADLYVELESVSWKVKGNAYHVETFVLRVNIALSSDLIN